MTPSESFLRAALQRDIAAEPEQRVHVITARRMIEVAAEQANRDGDAAAYERCVEAREAFLTARIKAPELPPWTGNTRKNIGVASPNAEPSDSYDPNERAREKQTSRDEDARALAAGEKNVEELHRENSFLSPEGGRINFAAAKRGALW